VVTNDRIASQRHRDAFTTINEKNIAGCRCFAFDGLRIDYLGLYVTGAVDVPHRSASVRRPMPCDFWYDGRFADQACRLHAVLHRIRRSADCYLDADRSRHCWRLARSGDAEEAAFDLPSDGRRRNADIHSRSERNVTCPHGATSMNTANTKRFQWHWFRYAIRDAAAQAFGWPAVAGAALLGYVIPKLGIAAIPNQIADNAAIAAASGIIGFAAYLFAALFKAYSRIEPLAVTVTDDIQSPDFAFHHQVRCYNAAVIVRNRSDVHLKDCIAHVMNAPQADGSTGPRFIEKFDLPPKSEKTVFIAYWSSRELPYGDDNDIGLIGPVGNCFDGNTCRIPGPAARLHIRIHQQDSDSKDVCCRVWIDGSERRLRAAPLPD
jgi:hypothetical protein